MTDDLQALNDEELQTLGRWMHGIRGPAIVDPDLPIDPEAEPTHAKPAGVRTWAGDRLAEICEEINRRAAEKQGRR